MSSSLQNLLVGGGANHYNNDDDAAPAVVANEETLPEAPQPPRNTPSAPKTKTSRDEQLEFEEFRIGVKVRFDSTKNVEVWEEEPGLKAYRKKNTISAKLDEANQQQQKRRVELGIPGTPHSPSPTNAESNILWNGTKAGLRHAETNKEKNSSDAKLAETQSRMTENQTRMTETQSRLVDNMTETQSRMTENQTRLVENQARLFDNMTENQTRLFDNMTENQTRLTENQTRLTDTNSNLADTAMQLANNAAAWFMQRGGVDDVAATQAPDTPLKKDGSVVPTTAPIVADNVLVLPKKELANGWTVRIDTKADNGKQGKVEYLKKAATGKTTGYYVTIAEGEDNKRVIGPKDHSKLTALASSSREG